MDATVGAATKALDTLKALPTWLLAGLSISFFAIWLWPPFLLALPEPARSVVPVALFVTSVLTLCNVAALLLGHAAARREHSLERDRERLLQTRRSRRFSSRATSRCLQAGPLPISVIASPMPGKPFIRAAAAPPSQACGSAR